MSAVCWRCIDDGYLKAMIRDDGTPEECSLCHRSDENTFGPEELAEVLDPILHRYFESGPYVRQFGEDDSEWEEQVGEPLSHHIQEIIGDYLGFEEEIVEALEENEDVRPQDGDEPFFEANQDYVHVSVYPYEYMARWDFVLEQLKHRRRFFSDAALSLFKDLFEGVESRSGWSSADEDDENVVRIFAQGAELYRARTCNSLGIK